MSRFINPFTDWGFKHIFGQEINKDMLIAFLNDLLDGERVIADLTFHDKEQLGETRDMRGVVYDVLCTADNGEEFIVEMQNNYQAHFIDRTLYYASRAVISQRQRGQDWAFALRPVYVVCFMNYGVGADTPQKFRTDIALCDMATGRQLNANLRFIYLVLPLFGKHEPEECETDFERWIYILNNMRTLARMPFEARNAVWKRLEEIADSTHLAHEEREKYEESCRLFWDYNNTLSSARILGLTQGREEGREEGRAEGRAEGILLSARNMKAMGLADEVIIEATGLSSDEVAAL